PIIYCDGCGVVPEKYENLPVVLPDDAPITGTGESPLAKVESFVNVACPKCGGAARRETDTMDTFVDSSWYYYRYLDPNNSEAAFDPALAEYWTPVDQYIGGDDHAVMHLIYARFWTKVMRDLGLVKFDEPFKRLLTQGMVVGETFFDDATGKRKYFPPDEVAVERDAKGKVISAFVADGVADKDVRVPLKYAIERMSKSKGNGVDPDEMVDIYGADAARLFVLFAAPVENELVWHESGIEGAVRFLQRVWRFVYRWRGAFEGFRSNGQPPANAGGTDKSPPANAGGTDISKSLRRKTHQTIKRVEDSLETLQFNTPVAGLMELINALYEAKIEPETAAEDEKFAVYEATRALVLMLTPFAPHTAEELYEQITGETGGMLASGARFTEYKPELAVADEIEIAVQVNGKLRSRILASPEASNAELEAQALADEKVKEFTDGKAIVKVVVVPKRLVNVVVK
ncbi:MAG: class I tRNA ligase family protein, partial [Pyrinomonadaceae bacterium]